MRKKIIKAVLFGLMLGIGNISLFNSVYAADSEVLTSMFVSPMSQMIILTPGESYTGSILVSNANQAKEDLHYSVEVGSYSRSANYETGDDYGAVDTEKRSSYNDMMDWIEFDVDSGVISPNETNIVKYTITVPKNAVAGTQCASILVTSNGSDVTSTDESKQDGETGVNFKTRYQIVSSIIANVVGETIETGSILENAFPAFLLNSGLATTSMVENTGNIYTDVEYKLQVWPIFSDEEIFSNEETPETETVLPETKKFHSQTVNLPSPGIYKVKQTVRIFGEESVKEGTIIYCPIWLMLVIIFGIVMIILWLVMSARGRKKAATRAGKTTEREEKREEKEE